MCSHDVGIHTDSARLSPPPFPYIHSEGCINTGHGMPSNHTQYMFFFASFVSLYLWGR